jgi:hypothetical protein
MESIIKRLWTAFRINSKDSTPRFYKFLPKLRHIKIVFCELLKINIQKNQSFVRLLSRRNNLFAVIVLFATNRQ